MGEPLSSMYEINPDVDTPTMSDGEIKRAADEELAEEMRWLTKTPIIIPTSFETPYWKEQ